MLRGSNGIHNGVEQVVEPERRERELVADFQLPIVDLNSRRPINFDVRLLIDCSVNSLRIMINIAICLILFGSLQPLSAQTSQPPQSGETVDGVQMAISQDGLIKTGVPNLHVVFRNVADRDLSINLGIIGGNSPRPCKLDSRNIPCTLDFKLNVTDSYSTTRTYTFRGIASVFGRLGSYVISLRAHSTYTLELGVDQFWSPATKEFEALSFAPGSYQLSLEFEGREPFAVNLDQPDLGKASLWKGKLTSNSLPIDIARAAQPNKSLGQDVAHFKFKGSIK